jgi:hypothetical protein
VCVRVCVCVCVSVCVVVVVVGNEQCRCCQDSMAVWTLDFALDHQPQVKMAIRGLVVFRSVDT